MTTNTTPLQFLHVGFGNYICANKVLVITRTDCAQGEKIKRDAKNRNAFFDMTFGRVTNSQIVMDDHTVFGSHFYAKTLVRRVMNDAIKIQGGQISNDIDAENGRLDGSDEAIVDEEELDNTDDAPENEIDGEDDNEDDE